MRGVARVKEHTFWFPKCLCKCIPIALKLSHTSSILNWAMHNNKEIVKSTGTKCIQNLKTVKADGNIGFDSDHLMNGNHKLHVMLCLSLNTMISHCYTANNLLFSAINLIPKNLKISPLTKTRGQLLFAPLLFSSYLYTSDLQFGFKLNHSLALCTVVYM